MGHLIAPQDFAVGGDGNIWFASHLGDQIGRVTPGGQITYFDMPTLIEPMNLVRGPNGNIWFNGVFGGPYEISTAGKVTALPLSAPMAIADLSSQTGVHLISMGDQSFAVDSSGSLHRIPLQPKDGSVTQEQLRPGWNALSRDGGIWFEEIHAGRIDRLGPDGTLARFTIPDGANGGGGSDFTQIIAGPDGNLWFTLPTANKIGKITPAGQVTEFILPKGELVTPFGSIPLSRNPWSLAFAADGSLWYAGRTEIGRLSQDGHVAQYLSFEEKHGPNYLAVAPDGNLWFAEGDDRIGRLSPTALPTVGITASVLATQAVRFEGTVATLTLANPENVTAVIDWGDGHTSPGRLVPAANGQFAVVGDNTYAQPGTFAVTVRVSDALNGTLTVAQGTVPVEENRGIRYLRAIYRDLLGRDIGRPFAGEDTGVLVWVDQLNHGQPEALVVLAIEQSVEYRTRTVDGLYQRLLGRAAEPFGRDIFVGFLGAGGTAAAVEAKILASPEYRQSHTDGSDSDFLRAVYKDVLARDVDPTGQMAWSQRLAQGASREDVAAAILSSDEGNDQLLQALYQQYLRRAADPSELLVWRDDLRRGGTAEQIRAGLVGSNEYVNRVDAA